MAIDAAGNVYNAGEFSGTVDFDPGTGVFNLTSTMGPFNYSSHDVFVTRIDASDALVWAKRIGDASVDRAYTLVTDAAGNCYISGVFGGTVDFDPGPGVYNLTAGNNYSVFILKLDATGAFVWAISYVGSPSGSSNVNSLLGLSLDAAGYLYAAGSYAGTVDFDPGTGIYNLTSAGDRDIVVNKLTVSGAFVWSRSMGGNGTDIGKAVAVDASGNVYTTGTYSAVADLDPGPGAASFTAAGLSDVFISKLDAAGNFIWGRSVGGPDYDISSGILTNAAGVYLSG